MSGMSDDLAEAKTQLRQQCCAVRKSLGDETRAHASQSICEALDRWEVFRQSESILTCMPIKGEVDLTALLARHIEKRWALPRIILEENHRMVFHSYDATRLIRHPFGMAEPAADLPVVPPKAIQLSRVLGLAFDHRGWRLGYGGGYFDRFLAKFSGVSVGIVFQALLLDEIPHGEHDVSMQWIATESGLLQTT
jgi:5-formyltetrahydrofolate cyclo-ligase